MVNPEANLSEHDRKSLVNQTKRPTVHLRHVNAHVRFGSAPVQMRSSPNDVMGTPMALATETSKLL